MSPRGVWPSVIAWIVQCSFSESIKVKQNTDFHEFGFGCLIESITNLLLGLGFYCLLP